MMIEQTEGTSGADTPGVSREPTRRLVDARPILRRGDENVWERTESSRGAIASTLDAVCRERGIEAFVLESSRYVHPAWVKFECWMPGDDPAMTARSSMTVEIAAVPYHRFEALYKVNWERHGLAGVIDRLHTFERAQVAAMLDFLCAPPARTPQLLNSARAILGEMQTRQAWWQLWRPANRVLPLRPDWLLRASLLAAAAGLLLLIRSLTGTLAAASSTSAAEVPPEHLPSVLAEASVLPVTVSSVQDPSLVTGALGFEDPTRAGGQYYDVWTFRGSAGEVFEIGLETTAFDPFLIVGRTVNGDFVELASDDDSGGDRNSLIVFTAPVDDTAFVIRASSFEGQATGDYTLRFATRTASAPPTQDSAPFEDSGDESPGRPGGLFGGLLLTAGLAGLIVTARTPQLVRSAGKPTAEPRVLLHLDSWQTVVFGAGDDVEEIRRRLLSLFQAPERFVCEVERIWHWGLDGKTERDQVVIRHGRAIVFCHLYGYGSDLYVGWDAQMNLGSWTEKQIAAGVDRSSGRRIRLMSVERAVQPTSEYDLVDLNCLAEWTHAQMTQVLKHYMREKQVDQEIDFTIIRGEREGITGEDKKEKIRSTKTDAGRFRFRRKS